MEVMFILYFKNAIPNDDYTLSIIYESGYEQEFPMVNMLKQFRFSPLQEIKVWKEVEVFPTHMEWNKGAFQVNLNIEEMVPDSLINQRKEVKNV